jgi:hypothetical protein
LDPSREGGLGRPDGLSITTPVREGSFSCDGKLLVGNRPLGVKFGWKAESEMQLIGNGILSLGKWIS